MPSLRSRLRREDLFCWKDRLPTGSPRATRRPSHDRVCLGLAECWHPDVLRSAPKLAVHGLLPTCPDRACHRARRRGPSGASTPPAGLPSNKWTTAASPSGSACTWSKDLSSQRRPHHHRRGDESLPPSTTCSGAMVSHLTSWSNSEADAFRHSFGMSRREAVGHQGIMTGSASLAPPRRASRTVQEK